MGSAREARSTLLVIPDFNHSKVLDVEEANIANVISEEFAVKVQGLVAQGIFDTRILQPLVSNTSAHRRCSGWGAHPR